VAGSIHVAIVGAGALGRVYGVHLENAGARTSFVVRPERLDDTSPFCIERLNGGPVVRRVASPVRVAEIPRTSDAILLAVRADQIDRALESRLKSAPDVPVIALTPILPRTQRRLSEVLGARLLIAMPTLAAKLDADGVVRYWAFERNPTLIERSERWRVVLARLSGRFAAAELALRLERDVARKNPATTVAFFPLSVAIGAAGSVSALAERRDLLLVAGEACRESLALARRLGPVEPAAAIGARLSGPLTVRALVACGRRLAPRAIEFIDAHFGAKLAAQHALFGEEILTLAREHGIPMPHLTRLLNDPHMVILPRPVPDFSDI
jgi:2-dehydropantoate 2-reductase